MHHNARMEYRYMCLVFSLGLCLKGYIMKLDLQITSTLPIINGNLNDVKRQLVAKLQQSDLIVDSDSVKVAKSMATSINKLKAEIAKKRKAIIAELSAPIKELENQAKELENLCEESRQKLLSQVKVFDDKERDKVKELLKKELQTTYSKYEVKAEFQIVKIEDLAIISNLTKTGLAKKARTAIDERVLTCKEQQGKIETRLLTLDSICFKAGLQSPLKRENINHFLMMENDDDYLEKLVSLIKNELNRLEDANKLKEKIESQSKRVKSSQVPNNEPKPTKYSHFKNMQEFTPIKRNIGKKTYVVTATFEVTVNESMGSSLEQMLIDKFQKTGFKQIPNIQVQEKLSVA